MDAILNRQPALRSASQFNRRRAGWKRSVRGFYGICIRLVSRDWWPGLQPTATTDSLYDYYTQVGAVDSRDNIRIRQVSISYTLPDEFISGSGLGATRVTLAGYNLWWWDHCHCVDPNMRYTGGSEPDNFSGVLAMPLARKFLLSVRTHL